MNDHENTKKQTFSWKISPFLHKEIEAHLLTLQKSFKQQISKQKWVVQAITEKLRRQEENQEEIKNNRERIGFLIDPLNHKRLEEFVKKISIEIGEYSKQRLLLEAVLEKLSAEEESIKQKFLEQRLLLNALRDSK